MRSRCVLFGCAQESIRIRNYSKFAFPTLKTLGYSQHVPDTGTKTRQSLKSVKPSPWLLFCPAPDAESPALFCLMKGLARGMLRASSFAILHAKLLCKPTWATTAEAVSH